MKRSLEEQKNLEEELQKLQDAQEPKEVCQEIIKFIQVTGEDGRLRLDPMADQTEGQNPWHMQTCFVAGTKVLVSRGKYVNIENLRVGDHVVSIMPTNKARETFDLPIRQFPKHFCQAVVTGIFRTLKHKTTRIRIFNRSNGEETVLECTPNHPIYVYEKGWKTVSGEYDKAHGYAFDVGKLAEGDLLCLESGELAEVLSLTGIDHEGEGVAVYNLSVSHGRTYFANGVLTHNKCPCVIL